MRPILANKLFVPTEMVSEKVLKRFRVEWEELVIDEVVDEHGFIVYDGNRAKTTRTRVPHVYETFSQLHAVDRSYIALPAGDRDLVAEFLPHAIDMRSTASLPYRLCLGDHVLNDERWVDQSRCVEEYLRHGSGLILGKTGSGKTLMGIGVACRLGMRVLILSKRTAAEGVWEGDFRKHTNIEAVESRLGRRLIGPYKPRQKAEYDISIATVQTFVYESGFKKLVQRDQSAFGLVIVDEVNEIVSAEYGRLLGLWNPLCWLGLTATLERDDRRHHLALHHLGPVRAEGKADQMRPEVEFVHTGVRINKWIARPEKKFGKNDKLFRWRKSIDQLVKDEKRTKFIVDNIAEDIGNGRIVFAFSERNQLCRDIHEALRRRGIRAEFIIAATPKFMREEFYAKMRKRELTCIVAGKTMDAMVSVDSIDCLHVCTPINKEKDLHQIYGRTRRPEEGKLIPLVRHYIDIGGQVEGGARNCRKHCERENWTIRTRPFVANPGMMQFPPPTQFADFSDF